MYAMFANVWPVLGQGTFMSRGASGPTGGSSNDLMLILWIACGVLAIAIQALMAVWVVQDARAKGKSPGWAAFVAIPVIGLIGLFTYIVIPGGPTPEQRENERRIAALQSEAQQLRDQAADAQRVAQQERERVDQVANQAPLFAPVRDKATVMFREPIARMLRLTHINGRNLGLCYDVRLREPNGRRCRSKLGRDAQCDVSIPDDPLISREHCLIWEESDDGVYVNDMGSSNGTIVERDGGARNGKIAGKTQLLDRDVLVVGDCRLRVDLFDPPEAPADIPDFQA